MFTCLLLRHATGIPMLHCIWYTHLDLPNVISYYMFELKIYRVDAHANPTFKSHCVDSLDRI